MMGASSIRRLLAVSSLMLGFIEASHDPFQHNNPSQHYTFTHNVSIDPVEDDPSVYDPASSSTTSPDSKPTDSPSTQLLCGSSLIYDDNVQVSSVMMVSGGDMGCHPSSNFNYYSDLEDESDDDDDDNDDGHSSMLSNASLRRSLATANGGTYRPKSHSRNTHSKPGPPILNSSPPSAAALRIRGGAATNMGSEFVQKLFVAALVTLVYEGVMGHILEFVKVIMQTSQEDITYSQALKSITAEKGLAGLWDGFIPWGVVQAVFKGGVFGLAHAMATRALEPMEGKVPHKLLLTVAGGIAGGCQGYVLSPTLLLKTRVMTNPVFRENMSLLKTTLLSFTIGFDVVRSEGLSALLKGANVFATKRVFDWASRYFFSDVFESILLKIKGSALTASEKAMASLLGGFFSTVVTLPLDVLVSKTQDAKQAGVKVSPWKLFTDELEEKGWGGLQHAYARGFEARLAHVCFTTVAMKTFSPIVHELLFGEKTKKD
jgi:hypothetical protein